MCYKDDPSRTSNGAERDFGSTSKAAYIGLVEHVGLVSTPYFFIRTEGMVTIGSSTCRNIRGRGRHDASTLGADNTLSTTAARAIDMFRVLATAPTGMCH